MSEASTRNIIECDVGGRASLLLLIDGAAHVLLVEPVQAKCCGAMRAWFVNRDGRTRCYVCDEEYVSAAQGANGRCHA